MKNTLFTSAKCALAVAIGLGLSACVDEKQDVKENVKQSNTASTAVSHADRYFDIAKIKENYQKYKK